MSFLGQREIIVQTRLQCTHAYNRRHMYLEYVHSKGPNDPQAIVNLPLGLCLMSYFSVEETIKKVNLMGSVT